MTESADSFPSKKHSRIFFRQIELAFCFCFQPAIPEPNRPFFPHRFMCQLCANFSTTRYRSIIATDRCHRSMLCMFYCNDISITSSSSSSSSKCTITVLESSRQSAFAGAGDDGNTGNIIDRRQWRKATRLPMNTSAAAAAAALSHLTFSIYTFSLDDAPLVITNSSSSSSLQRNHHHHHHQVISSIN